MCKPLEVSLRTYGRIVYMSNRNELSYALTPFITPENTDRPTDIRPGRKNIPVARNSTHQNKAHIYSLTIRTFTRCRLRYRSCSVRNKLYMPFEEFWENYTDTMPGREYISGSRALYHLDL